MTPDQRFAHTMLFVLFCVFALFVVATGVTFKQDKVFIGCVLIVADLAIGAVLLDGFYRSLKGDL